MMVLSGNTTCWNKKGPPQPLGFKVDMCCLNSFSPQPILMGYETCNYCEMIIKPKCAHSHLMHSMNILSIFKVQNLLLE